MGVKSKLDNMWEEGWRVIGIVGPVNFKIQHVDGRIRVVHINRLQPHIKRPVENNSFTVTEPCL